MKWIAIRSKGPRVSVSETAPKTGYAIRVGHDRHAIRDSLEHLLFFDVMYPLYYSERGLTSKQRAFSLKPPDAWLIAVAAVIWEGLLQGASWDLIKTCVLSALSQLRDARLAPTERDAKADSIPSKSKKKVQSVTEVGFNWIRYGTEGRPLYNLFLGIRREFNKMDAEQRQNTLKKRKKKGR